MALPASPPRYPTWAALVAPITRDERFLRKHMSGPALEDAIAWRAYAVQCVLTPRGVLGQLRRLWVWRDGVWGDATEKAVRTWQRKRGLTVDGIFGAKSMSRAIEEAGTVADRAHGLPDGTCRGVGSGEGADVLAATNWFTPINARPAADIGPEQRRRFIPFVLRELRQSFSVWWALRNCARTLRARQKEYMARSARLAADPQEALRVAVLAHNAPFLAEQLVKYGQLLNPNTLATWTHKPGGGHYTYQEWTVHYPATILKYVA